MKSFQSFFSGVEIPSMVKIRQSFPVGHIENARVDVRQKLLAAGLGKVLFPGAQVAITAGSRGMGGLTDLLAGTVDAIKSVSGIPFIVPSMGSHGGATAEGQTEILRRLGAADPKIQAPIKATMETWKLGVAPNGAEAHINRIAAQANGIIVLGRVKIHPENAEGVASGLLKMTTVGLGNQIGAQQAHSHGLWKSVKAVPQITLEKCKVLFGVAVVENAFRQPVAIEVVPGRYEAFLEADKRLLKTAAPHTAKIPFQQLDLLIVDELGKTIAGTGMDLNVIGKWRVSGGPRIPDFRCVAVLSLTHGSYGNGLGIGMADFTTERFLKEFDPYSTYVNLFTATEPGAMNTREGMLPLALPNDREAIEGALYSLLAPKKPRVCRIKNTALLDEMWVSEALLEEVDLNSQLSRLEEPCRFQFDESQNLF